MAGHCPAIPFIGCPCLAEHSSADNNSWSEQDKDLSAYDRELLMIINYDDSELGEADA